MGLKTYYGGDVSDFKFLKKFEIKKATIIQKPGFYDQKIDNGKNFIFAGDQFTNGSIEGAVESGLNAAKKVLDN